MRKGLYGTKRLTVSVDRWPKLKRITDADQMLDCRRESRNYVSLERLSSLLDHHDIWSEPLDVGRIYMSNIYEHTESLCDLADLESLCDLADLDQRSHFGCSG